MEKNETRKKIFHTVKKIILLFLVIYIIFLIGVFLLHKYKCSKERTLLKEAGYFNLISAGDYNLNAHIYGNETGKHTIVGISGMDTNDYAVTISGVTDKLSDKNKISVIDRAGYGLSDDTTKAQTVDRIVSDYRTSLKNAGCNPPYVLMAHSLGGVYATYWESTYPDEVEAVIYLDPTSLSDISFLDEDDTWDAGIGDFLQAFNCKLGFQRIYYLFNSLKPWGGVPEDKLEYSKAFWWKNMCSFGKYSENKLCKENITKVYNSIKTNDIPKLYIDALSYTKEDLKEEFVFINQIYDSFGMEEEKLDIDNESFLNEIWSKRESDVQKNYDNNIKPYMDRLGNCTYVNIPGYHHIFLQKPDEVSKECERFLETLQ